MRYTVNAMLQLSKVLTDKGVLSLRTGGEIATVTGPIINPDNLKIEGFYCNDRFGGGQLILLTQDIRDHIGQGFVVNDHEVLADPAELIRLKPILDLQFALIGKSVVTVSKNRVGKVSDYAVEDSTMTVQKLYVSQSLIKSFSGGQLSIDRNQIVEITDRKIVIQDLLKTEKSAAPAAMPAA